MCTAGTCGLAMWATRLMPVAKKLGSSSAPGMERANSSLKRPPTVETLTPTFSNTLPPIWPRTPASAGRAVVVGAVPGGESESGVAAGLALDRLERRADAVAEAIRTSRGRPVAGRRGQACQASCIVQSRAAMTRPAVPVLDDRQWPAGPAIPPLAPADHPAISAPIPRSLRLSRGSHICPFGHSQTVGRKGCHGHAGRNPGPASGG